MSLAIRCKNVTKQYEHFTLDHLNLEIPNGSIIGRGQPGSEPGGEGTDRCGV